MDIDQQDGTIRLANGLVITASLTQEAFQADPASRTVTRLDRGAPPWITYRLPGGTIDDRAISLGLCFHAQVIVSVDINVNLYGPGPKTWDSYSDKIEAAAKDFHDRLLQHLFSKHETSDTFHVAQLSDDVALLAHSTDWPFAWGAVSSFHDPQSLGTKITVSYGNRLADAVAAPARPAAVRAVDVSADERFASGFEAAKLELARGNTTGAIRLVRQTSGMGLEQAKALVASWEKPL
jgi:hypothetical protein